MVIELSIPKGNFINLDRISAGTMVKVSVFLSV